MLNHITEEQKEGKNIELTVSVKNLSVLWEILIKLYFRNIKRRKVPIQLTMIRRRRNLPQSIQTDKEEKKYLIEGFFISL